LAAIREKHLRSVVTRIHRRLHSFTILYRKYFLHAIKSLQSPFVNRFFWLLAFLLLNQPLLLAQRGSRGGAGSRAYCVHDCPTPTDTDDQDANSKDPLKDFNRIVALQASPEQTAAFNNILKDIDAAAVQLQSLRDLLREKPTAADLSLGATGLNHEIAKIHVDDQGFLATFSDTQKSGLKEATKRLLSADADLTREMKNLDLGVEDYASGGEKIFDAVPSVDKTFSSLRVAQLALGDEMNIVLPSSGHELAFHLPHENTSFNIEGESISLPSAGIMAKVSAANGDELFRFTLNTDGSDLQRNIADILRARLNRSPLCGERIEVQDATLVPDPPAGKITARMHFERWLCASGGDPYSGYELMADDAVVDIELIPSVGENAFTLSTRIVEADANAALREELLHGSLGEAVRSQTAEWFQSILQKATDINSIFPVHGQKLAVPQEVAFQGSGNGLLSLMLNGRVQLSDEQAKELTSQFKQNLSTKAVPPQ